MAAIYRSDFKVWLCSRLKTLNLDDEILGQYITGILYDDDSTIEEKEEALQDTLEGMIAPCDNNIFPEILSKWEESEKEIQNINKDKAKKDILADVIAKQTEFTTNTNNKQTHKLDEDIKMKLIAQYAQDSDEELDCNSEDENDRRTQSKPTNEGLFYNTNATSVLEKAKEQREKQRLENENRKGKIKEDREKQKAKVEQRKDKEKKRTQKGERRR